MGPYGFGGREVGGRGLSAYCVPDTILGTQDNGQEQKWAQVLAQGAYSLEAGGAGGWGGQEAGYVAREGRAG